MEVLIYEHTIKPKNRHIYNTEERTMKKKRNTNSSTLCFLE